MATAEASATPAPTTVLGHIRLLLRDIFNFVRCPLMHEGTRPWTKITALLIACVIAIDLAIDSGLHLILQQADTTLIDLPDALPFEYNLMGDILSLLILAPLVEEIIFRGWLSGRKASLRFAFWGAIAAALILLSEIRMFSDSLIVLAIGAAVISAIGFIQWLLTYRRDADIPAWFKRNFRWFVWGGAIAFGALHLMNFEPITNPIHMLVILPETIGGLLLAFTRITFGLRAAIVQHFTFNLVYMLSGYLA